MAELRAHGKEGLRNVLRGGGQGLPFGALAIQDGSESRRKAQNAHNVGVKSNENR
jgi:hypothetical protein